MLDATDVRSVLERMRIEDPNYRVFGAEIHQYQLGQTLPESEVRAFEDKYQIRLPEDYRHFLTDIGHGKMHCVESNVFGANAGAGPYYGLLPLDMVTGDCLPEKPFPLTLADDDPEGIDIFGEDSDEEEFLGVIAICHQGCAIFSNLVVNGESYGTIWDSADDKLYALKISFEKWYTRWLNNLIDIATPILQRERRVASVKIGMAMDEVTSICGGEWKQRVYETPRRHSTLSSPDFATQFELGEGDRVARIIAHRVYLR